MQKTTQLELYTWEEDDPVSLEQMNGNFTKLDQNGAQTHAHLAQHEQALACTAFHLAQGALETLHADGLGDRRGEMVLADFTKLEQWASIWHLNLLAQDGSAPTQIAGDLPHTSSAKPVPATAGFSELQVGINCAMMDSVNTYNCYARDGLLQTLTKFVATRSGEVTSINLSITETDQMAFELIVLDEGTEVARAEVASVSSWTAKTVSIGFPIYAGHLYTLQVKMPDGTDMTSAKAVSMRSYYTQTAWQGVVFPRLNGSGVTYTSGWFETKSFTARASGTLRVWLTHQGTQPVVEVAQDGTDVWTTIPAVLSEAAQSLSGVSCQRCAYALPDVQPGTYRLRVTLPDETSVAEEVCGMVL